MDRSKYKNNIIESHHRLIRRMTRPMLGLKNFWSAARLITGIEMVNMFYRGQIDCPGNSIAERFASLAG